LEQKRKQVEKSNLVPPLYSPDDELTTLSNATSIFYRKNEVCEPVECQIYILLYREKVFVFQNYQYRQLPSQNELFFQMLSTFEFTQMAGHKGK
jgi:hypothetical protein